MHFLESGNPWEQAFFKQSYDAAVGRLFRGLIHNLNGVIQAVSMQSELMAMMVNQGLGLARKLQEPLPDEAARECGIQLQEILARRSQAMTEMQEKIKASQQIMKRTALLPEFRSELYTVNSAVKTEMEFLAVDSFFKHKVKKDLQLAEDIPPMMTVPLEIHQVLHAVLVNAAESMDGCCEDPALNIDTSFSNNMIHICIKDCGPGIRAEDKMQIFEPFFSTKKDHLGLGLYLAKKLLLACDGEITCESSPGATRFVISIPSDRI